jgi:hypothetical protein
MIKERDINRGCQESLPNKPQLFNGNLTAEQINSRSISEKDHFETFIGSLSKDLYNRRYWQWKIFRAARRPILFLALRVE